MASPIALNVPQRAAPVKNRGGVSVVGSSRQYPADDWAKQAPHGGLL